MAFSAETLTLLVLVSLGLAGLALFLLTTVAPRRRRLDSGEGPTGERVERALEEHAEAIGRLRGDVRGLADVDASTLEVLARAVQRVGLVRFDAFEDMGGRLSFSLALLDESGDGVVLTSINGRQDTRVYAKPVTGASSEHNLSEEESLAIRRAMAGSRTISA